MRKMMIGATLALVLTAGLAMAQSGGPPPGRGQGGPPGPGGRGGAERMLLRGITLSDAQKSQLDALHESQRAAMDKQREEGQALFEQIRDARERGDTATANRLMSDQRAKMEAQRDRMNAAVRALLTPDQQAQFDQNVAEMKARQAQFPAGPPRRPPLD